MNILLIHPHDIYSSQEPWTVRIVSIAKELKKTGHQVKLIYFPINWQEGITPSDLSGIQTIPFSRRVGPVTLLRNIAKIYRIGKWADIIHFQKCFHWASIPALVTAYLRGKPIHYDWDDWEEKIFIASNKKPFFPLIIFIRWLERHIPKIVNTVSVSSAQLENLCRALGVKKEKIFRVPVGADLDEFNPLIPADGIRKKYDLSGLVIFYHGQLHGAQYAHIFIQAARYIEEEHPQVNFMLIGDGGKLKELQEYARELNLKKMVFTGAIPHNEVPRYIASVDICAAPFEENDITRCKSPLKIAEYLAAGKPIVASDVGEVSRMIGDAGILTKAGDVKSLAKGLLLLINDKNLRDRLSRMARRRAEEIYNWPAIACNIKEAYTKAAYVKDGC